MDKDPTVWWELRRKGEATHSYLSRVLSDLGAHSLALKAEQCHYDDFLCPDEFDDGRNSIRLCDDILQWSRSYRGDDTSVHVRAVAMRDAAMRAEFDRTGEEARTWARSLDGQRTFRSLFEK